WRWRHDDLGRELEVRVEVSGQAGVVDHAATKKLAQPQPEVLHRHAAKRLIGASRAHRHIRRWPEVAARIALADEGDAAKRIERCARTVRLRSAQLWTELARLREHHAVHRHLTRVEMRLQVEALSEERPQHRP